MAVVLVVCIVYCVFRIDLYCSPLGGFCVQHLDGKNLLNHPFSTTNPPSPTAPAPAPPYPPSGLAPPRRLMGRYLEQALQRMATVSNPHRHGAGPGLVGRGGLAAKWSIATIMPARVWGS
jgi:hypothetical protein